jgi:hypothetical protein
MTNSEYNEQSAAEAVLTTGEYAPAQTPDAEAPREGATTAFGLRRAGDRLLYSSKAFPGGIPVRLAWARPITGRGCAIVVMHAAKKEDVATIDGIDRLDAETRRLVEHELAQRYFMPRITRVVKTKAHFGNRYWHVETDRGDRKFLMKSPETDVTWITEDHCVLRDSLGNCYEIESFGSLDRASKLEADKVL